MELKTITVRLIKSSIGATVRQKRTLEALGLKHINQEIKHSATPAILGMLDKMQRWVEVK
jgi:large subunit ribosomal protein L30